MKNMKLIMENFRKTMKEAWPGTEEPKAPWVGKPNYDWSGQIKAKNDAKISRKETMRLAIEDIMRQYDEREMHDMVYDELEDLFTNTFTDNLPKKDGKIKEEDLPTENEIKTMMSKCGLFKPVEKDDPMASDMEDNPGVEVGQDAKWK